MNNEYDCLFDCFPESSLQLIYIQQNQTQFQGKKNLYLLAILKSYIALLKGHFYGLGGASDQWLIKGLVFSTKCLPERKVTGGSGLVIYIMYFFICADKSLPKTSLYIMHIGKCSIYRLQISRISISREKREILSHFSARNEKKPIKILLYKMDIIVV